MFRNSFKIAWRSIRKHPIYTSINIVGLSIGICISLIIFLISDFELSFDKFHPDKDRIYRVVGYQQELNGKRDDIGAGMMNPVAANLRRELSGFEKVAAFYNYYARVSLPNGSGEPKIFEAAKRGEEVSSIIVTDPEYFDIFKYQWLAGNPATALKEPFKVVLSQAQALKYFGKEPLQVIIGKDLFYRDIYLNDSLHLTVTGIVKDWQAATDFGFKDFISLATVEHSFLKMEIQLDHWGNWNPDGQAFVKLSRGVSVAQVERQFPKFVKDHIPPYPGFKTELALQPLEDIHFNNSYHDNYSRQAHMPTLYALMGIAAFILIIAAINFINLSTAQSLRRAKEIGVRKVLGSSKTNLSVQFLIETLVITFISVLLSVIISFPILKFFQSMIPEGVTLDLFNVRTLVFLLSITIITSFLAGFYPAKVLSSYLPVISLKGQHADSPNQKNYLRKSLIVFQFTVSLIFIISTIVVGDQIHFVLTKDLGFSKDAVVTFRTSRTSFPEQAGVFAEKIKQIPSVQMVSIHMEAPAARTHSQTHLDLGQTKVPAMYEMCDENYVPLYGLKIIAGKNISHSDTVRDFLINETCARAFGFIKPADVIGKYVQNGMNEHGGYIVGVVKDFHSKSLHESIAPFFISSDKNSQRAISVKLALLDQQGSGLDASLKKIEKIWREIYPSEKFEFSFFDDTIVKLYAKEQKTGKLMKSAMGVAILISCLGLFGLATFTAQQRAKEIGIRKLLGASVIGITSMLSKDFLKLVIIALLISSPIAYYFMDEWLQDFAYRIHISVWVFVLSGLLAITIAMLTISYQAITAAVKNPVHALRSE